MTALPPILIPELDPAGPIDYDNDYLVIRQDLNDKKVTPGQLSNLRLQSFDPLPSPITSADVIIVGRNDGMGNYINYRATPQSLGFLTNNEQGFNQPTTCFFWMLTAPLGWVTVQGIGDRVLAVADLNGNPLYQYTAPGVAGTWQQSDVNGVAGTGLTITQIPNHNHWGEFGRTQSNSDATFLYGSSKKSEEGNPRYGTHAICGIVGGKGDNADHNNYGECDPHNHGALWRPAAAVGLICSKVQ